MPNSFLLHMGITAFLLWLKSRLTLGEWQVIQTSDPKWRPCYYCVLPPGPEIIPPSHWPAWEAKCSGCQRTHNQHLKNSVQNIFQGDRKSSILLGKWRNIVGKGRQGLVHASHALCHWATFSAQDNLCVTAGGEMTCSYTSGLTELNPWMETLTVRQSEHSRLACRTRTPS